MLENEVPGNCTNQVRDRLIVRLVKHRRKARVDGGLWQDALVHRLDPGRDMHWTRPKPLPVRRVFGPNLVGQRPIVQASDTVEICRFTQPLLAHR